MKTYQIRTFCISRPAPVAFKLYQESLLGGLFLLLAVGAQVAPQDFSGGTSDKNLNITTANWGNARGCPYTALWAMAKI